VEDIVDSGRTALALLAHYREAGAASVKLASLLSKPARRTTDCEPDYLCFEVEDKFVIGYGLDFDELYRELPYVGVLKPELYAE
jgi:hypoxanthine phosphoribosyltransferase